MTGMDEGENNKNQTKKTWRKKLCPGNTRNTREGWKQQPTSRYGFSTEFVVDLGTVMGTRRPVETFHPFVGFSMKHRATAPAVVKALVGRFELHTPCFRP
jgi:hypothetical protein